MRRFTVKKPWYKRGWGITIIILLIVAIIPLEDDYTDPIIILNDELVIPVGANWSEMEIVEELEISVTDDKSEAKNVEVDIYGISNINTSKEGIYELEIYATDEAGNVASVTTEVKVEMNDEARLIAEEEAQKSYTQKEAEQEEAEQEEAEQEAAAEKEKAEQEAAEKEKAEQEAAEKEKAEQEAAEKEAIEESTNWSWD